MNGSKILKILISSGAYSQHNEINTCYKRGVNLVKGRNLQNPAECTRMNSI
jgi:hypothetical protein